MAMNPGAPKENANPTILSVNSKDRAHSRRSPLDWSQLGSFEKRDENLWMPTSATDQSIIKALADISRETNGRGVSLLRAVGLEVPSSAADALRYPVFCPSDNRSEEIPPLETSPQQDESKEEPTPPTREAIDAEEVFDIIRNIQDPEHPNTLEELGVVSLGQLEVIDQYPSANGTSGRKSVVNVRFTPTIPHCSMATLIGLCIHVKLLRSLPPRFKISVQIEPGSHASENSINKQLRDKERVCAALENNHLTAVVNKCIKEGAMSSTQ